MYVYTLLPPNGRGQSQLTHFLKFYPNHIYLESMKLGTSGVFDVLALYELRYYYYYYYY